MLDEYEAAAKAQLRERSLVKDELVRLAEELELLRLFMAVPEAARATNRKTKTHCGFVYLLRHGQYSLFGDTQYRIGKTDRTFRERLREHRRRTKEEVHAEAKYATLYPLALEKALHDYYDRYRVRRSGERVKGQREYERGELFRADISPPEFREVAAKLEPWVLKMEEANLELELLELVAWYKRIGGRDWPPDPTSSPAALPAPRTP